MKLKFETIGYWSEIKHEIIGKYASAYTILLTKKKFSLAYIDAFAGAGTTISRTTGNLVAGSPQIALEVKPPFNDYYFIDIDSAKVNELKKLAALHENVHIYEGDANDILLESVFPQIEWDDFRRGLCLLDPYGLHLNWNFIKTAGQMKTIDMFLNFPVADMNRNVLWHNPEGVDESDIVRMNAFWGNESWRKAAYNTQNNLFNLEMKEDNETVARAFRKRLQTEAKFAHVSEPLPMRNSKGSIVYYLFFASQVEIAADIIRDIFSNYRKLGEK